MQTAAHQWDLREKVDWGTDSTDLADFSPFNPLDEKEVGVASMSGKARAQHRVCKSLAGKNG